MQAQETDSHKVVLLIEGHPDVEAVVRTVLEPYGWQIVLARDNAAALEQVKLRGFELICDRSAHFRRGRRQAAAKNTGRAPAHSNDHRH